MYIDKLKLWNFRKYGKETFALDDPHLTVEFNRGLNVLIGDNDSGKTAILDAIKLTLRTHSYEWIRIEDKDFYNGASKLRIEIEFKGLEDNEARHFIEWLGWYEELQEDDSKINKPLLRIIYEVERNSDRILPSEICAGMDNIGTPLNALAREFLKTTYLKALRDADNELTAKRNSRVSQILRGHDLLKEVQGEEHYLERVGRIANAATSSWFDQPDHSKDIKDIVDEFLQSFIGETSTSEFSMSNPDLVAILEKVAIGITGNTNPGLGTMNRLYMALELLHLRKEWDGLKLCLIEELEAHLHPQAQLKVVEKLQQEVNTQFILTTHSPNIASKVPLESLIICKNNFAYSMGAKYTKLDNSNYVYLERFLDATKANLFFAKGVLIVEGWAEQLIIPILAHKIDCDLTAHEVSVVNVASTAYLHFAKIFLREDGTVIKNNVSVITDLDIREYEREPQLDENGKTIKDGKSIVYNYINQNINNHIEKVNHKEISLITPANDYIKAYVSKMWTLEYCLLKSSILSSAFKASLKEIHSEVFSAEKISEKEWEVLLARILLSKSIKKVELANSLSNRINDIDFAAYCEESDSISYITKAIKHACGYDSN